MQSISAAAKTSVAEHALHQDTRIPTRLKASLEQTRIRLLPPRTPPQAAEACRGDATPPGPALLLLGCKLAMHDHGCVLFCLCPCACRASVEKVTHLVALLSLLYGRHGHGQHALAAAKAEENAAEVEEEQ
eukprot:1141305-Pelagomonas_calceolata.AAC.4